jgi:hypothetical protein
MRPPSASTMPRAMARPIPNPIGLSKPAPSLVARKNLSNTLAKFLRYAVPFVLNGYHYHLILRPAGGDFYPRAGGRIFRRVVN